MQNIIDYAERELTPFSGKPLGELDSLIFSQLSYVFLDTVVPGFYPDNRFVLLKDLLKAEYFQAMFDQIRVPELNKRMLFALASSPRYRNLQVQYYVNEWDDKQEKQFSAVTFVLGNHAYLAYRGTDATFVGWKEDFNMAFLPEIPAQRRAVEYLEEVASRIPGDLYVGGHSKGGNLAVYAAIRCLPSVQKRILTVFSHDGPGFKDLKLFQSEAFQRIQGRIRKTIPQSSLIGMLLENHEAYTIVRSSRIGLMQHDPFSWEVEDDHFCMVEQLTSGAKYINQTLHDWIAGLSPERLEIFINTLYEVIEAGGSSTPKEWGADWGNETMKMLAAGRNVDPETRAIVLQTFADLAKMALKNLAPAAKEELQAKIN